MENKILIVCPFHVNGGAFLSTRILGQNMLLAGAQVDFLSDKCVKHGDFGVINILIWAINIVIEKVSIRLLLALGVKDESISSNLFSIPYAINFSKYSVIVLSWCGRGFYSLYSNLSMRKIIVWHHDLWWGNYFSHVEEKKLPDSGIVLKFLARRARRRKLKVVSSADVINIFPSSLLKDRIQASFEREVLGEVIPSFNLGYLNALSDTEKYLAAAVSFAPYSNKNKNLSEVVALFKRISGCSHRKSRFLIISDDEKSPIMNFDDLDWRKAGDLDIVNEVLSNARILVSISRFESFCMICAEAICSGVKIVVSINHPFAVYAEEFPSLVYVFSESRKEEPEKILDFSAVKVSSSEVHSARQIFSNKVIANQWAGVIQ